MPRMYVRWVAAAVGVTVGWVTLSPAPAAYAGLDPLVRQRTSDITTNATASVTVGCLPGSLLFALGAEIHGGSGDVALTGLYPGPDLRAATAVATARSANPTPYAVTVSAICQPATRRAPDLVQASVQGGTQVEAECLDDDAVLFGLGYLLDQPVGPATGRVDALVPNPTLRRVSAHATDAAPGSRLTVFGICYAPRLDPGAPAPYRVEATTDEPGWPKAATTAPGDGSTFGVGGVIRGAGPVYFDALTALSSTVGGARASRTNAPASLLRVDNDDDDEESLTAYAIRGGTFH
jgi:hypothetical protein